MKILYIADPNLIHDIRWIDRIRDKGHECFIIPRKRHYVDFKRKCKGLPKGIHMLAPIQDPSTVRPYRDLLQAFKILWAIRKNRIDLLHVMYAEPNALWGNWSFLFNVPMMLTTLGTDILITIPSFFKKRDLLSKLIAWQYLKALNKFKVITCTSQSQLVNLTALGLRPDVSVIRTGVDNTRVKSLDLDVAGRIALDKPFILMPRNMKPIYNHEFTLDAIALLNRSLLDKYCFVFVGSDNGERSYFESIYRKASAIPADVRFFESFSHEEMVSLCKQAVLVVMNPVSDGSPVSAMEAIACRTPVILPPLMYDSDIFEVAFFFPQWRPDALKKKIEEVLALDHDMLNERLIKGSETIERLGDLNREIDKIEIAYKSMLSHGVRK